MIVYPTHTCFDDAVELAGKIMHPDTVETDEFVIVHAVVAPYGAEIAHAWIEATKQDKVLFVGVVRGERTMLAADRTEFYADIKVKDTTRYTFLEAYAEEKRTGCFGPWVERYRALVRDPENAIPTEAGRLV